MMLNQGIESLPNTSHLTIKKLKHLNIHTVYDLINYVPFRYEDFSILSKIGRVQPGETITVQGMIANVKNQYTRSRITIQKVTLQDDTGTIEIIWYNQPYLTRILKVGSFLSVSGTADKSFSRLTIQPKEYEVIPRLSSETIHTARIVPVYSETYGLSTRTIREKMYRALVSIPKIPEYLPVEIVRDNELTDVDSALRQIHFPSSLSASERARERLASDELFIIQLSSHLLKKEWALQKPDYRFTLKGEQEKKLSTFVSELPFELTSAQKRVVEEVKTDMLDVKPMNRFIQGDVGSGKTVVAGIASLIALLNGTRTLLMAPTEILATQHYQTFCLLFKNTPFRVGLHTGSKKLKKNPLDFDIVIGTHALISQNMAFRKVGLVVIDEQQRFGVMQRSLLKKKGGSPHLLTMTATPIPRTVALTLYGELDLSVIDEMPKGRIPVKTYLVPLAKRNSGYLWMKKKIREESIQIFIVCPLIEESQMETMKSVRAVKSEFEHLKNEVFSGFNVGLLHGKMKPKEKDRIMEEFKKHEYDILVTTPVVEVGIDIPNATIVLIEGAERFGLAQLHQLRGRVGRGSAQSYCFLFTGKEEKPVLSRLHFFCRTQSGIQLAEYDFRARGPGDMFGTKQHGYMDLKVASLTDLKLIEKTKHAASSFMQSYKIDDFPEIKRRVETYRARQIARD
ncbi:ATP-dependent DNA helicase RecG [Candidatus Roizmanbacteria bacterium CG09_land_8_20_14_0_10_41_9]|uniref:Probable DNA 3'-5' helicase RecG n=1 Tax=Candidatus Roizmanbacteria bacterium CG09_land_8_20_14_0_10_41_9 TaxID=1974850 RepID=A0A2H0WTY1_9BACT|nr:MAG: ATP-dependent DNA helicase RecG [Candidatus Roizmanbacteria bacterium CG09_land_8_20_14_0_10_41_9]